MSKKLHIHASLNKGYGWKRPSLPSKQHPRLIPHFEGALPAVVDLRPKMPAVYDQGQLGACTAHALGGLAEYLMIAGGQTAYVPSRLFIYYNERAMEGTVSDDAGAAIADGATVISKLGCPNESKWWYNIDKFRVKPSKSVYTEAAKHVVQGIARVDQNLDGMKQVIASGHPIAGGFTVYESFESQEVEETGIVPMPGRFESVLGGHAVLLSGYDDSKQSFLVRNSWGADWGIGGYCWMSYNYWTDPDLSDDFWTASNISNP